MTKKKGYQKFLEIGGIFGEMEKFFRETPKKRSLKNFCTNLAPPFLKSWIR